MNRNPTPRELEVLWRLAGCGTWSEPTAEPGGRFLELRQRVVAALLELVIAQLEEQPPDVKPRHSDLAVLLSSQNSRLRMLGVRLLSLG
jgi:hypothetical protein